MSSVAFAEKSSIAPALRAGVGAKSASGGLRIGEPNDSFEREADHIADEVMLGAATRRSWSFSRMSIDSRLQRKCACGGSAPEGECEECKEKQSVLRRKALGSDRLDEPPPVVNEALRSPGDPLDTGTRVFFERHFGHNFGGVRVHTDSLAAQSAHAVGARAYTVGNNIVFGAGQHAPATPSGRRLLAHELAHVVQQGRGGPSVEVSAKPSLEQSAEHAAESAITGNRIRIAGSAKPHIARFPIATTPADFPVAGKKQDPGDIMNIYFDRNSSALDAAEKTKIPLIISSVTPAVPMKLNGFRSEDEPAALANDRAHKVDSELGAAVPPHTAARTIAAIPAAGVGKVEYRESRRVEVLPAPTAAPPPVSAVPTCGGPPPVCDTAFKNAFNSAQPVAKNMVSAAVTALGTAPLAANTTTLLTTLFGGAGVAGTIKTKLSNLVTHLTAMPAQFRCHNQCDGFCTNPAYNCGVGVGVPAADPCNTPGSKSMMTLCPDFRAEPDVNKRAQLLIHEGSHGTTGLQTVDLSYGVERGIISLSAADSLRNTDSYVLLVRNLHTPGSVPIGPTPADKVTDAAGTGDCPTKDPVLCRALAHLEKWAVTARQDVSLLYDEVGKALPPGSWSAGHPQLLMRDLAPLFGLTDPGAGPAFTHPTADDKLKLAGIYDRYNSMMYQVYLNQLKINKVAVGADSWTVGKPATITLTPPFDAIGATVDKIKRLFELLAAATPTITAALRPSYVEAADRIRKRRGYGP